LGFPLRSSGGVEEHSQCIEAGLAKAGRALGRENVGMSNRKPGAIPGHRKPKVSWAMNIIPGLVGPKVRLKSVADGQLVNIPAPYLICYSKTQFMTSGKLLDFCFD